MKLIVLLSAYNGEKFLRQQLDSLLAQTLRGVEVFARDDGSTDATRNILEEYRKKGLLRWDAGENLGAARSFWQLLQNCEEADYYAFCDQDDIWDPDKLAVAVRALQSLDPGKPALYCGDVRVADAGLRILRETMVRGMPTDYPHALLKNIAPGCTFVFNHPARELLRAYDAERLGIDLHDWTAFQIIACFGQVIFDPTPHMSYRQHGANAIGAHHTTPAALLKKIPSFWSGSMKNSRQRQALRLEQAYGEEMEKENRELTALLAHYCEDSTKKRRLLSRLEKSLSGADARMAQILTLINRL